MRTYCNTSLDKYLNTEDNTKQELNYKAEREKLYVKGLSGLDNMGNTCYINSILQCLSAISVFRAYMVTDDTFGIIFNNIFELLHNEKTKNSVNNKQVTVTKKEVLGLCMETLTYNLQELFITMWEENHKYITPKKLKEVIGDYCDTFKGYSQNDSQELLNLILDKLHEEMKVRVLLNSDIISEEVKCYLKVKKECAENINNKELAPEQRQKYSDYLHEYYKQHINHAIIGDAYVYWKKYIENSYSIITELFTGLFLSKVVCTECKFITVSFEPFTIFQLQIEDTGENTIDELLTSFCKEELLTGDNKYYCYECKKQTDAYKLMNIWSIPNILIIQLKRFKHEVSGTSKIESKVIFPLNGLDMKNYLCNDIHPIDKTTYDLTAVNVHLGERVDFGHYKSFTKNSLNNEWYEFNDEVIFHIPREEVENELITNEAYILFYTRNI